MQKNIFLIGFMGSGKSTIARTMKNLYGMQLLEMDEQIETEQGKKIPELFQLYGEEYFRRLETELLERLSGQENMVVSCGGGVPMRECNVRAMRKNGRIVYLSAGPDTVYQRIKGTHTRPLLEGNMNVEYIAQLMKQRLPGYQRAADLTVETDGKNAADICREILNQIQAPETSEKKQEWEQKRN